MSKIKKAAAIFIGVEIILYAVYMSLDIFTQTDTTAVKYVSVALCFAASFIYLLDSPKIDGRILINVGLFLTVVADLFLLVLNDCYVAGVAIFSAVQTVYAAYLHIDGKGVWTTVAARLVLTAAGITAASAYFGFSWLYALAAYYYLNSFVNVIEGFCCARKSKSNATLAAGLLLLMLCDACVGIRNVDLANSSRLIGFVNVAMWGFYLPSQILVAITPLLHRERNKKWIN